MAVRERDITKCVALARRFGARRLLLFGSALDEPNAARDIDLACEGVEGWDFFELLGHLREVLAVPVDLVDLSASDGIARLARKRGKILYES